MGVILVMMGLLMLDYIGGLERRGAQRRMEDSAHTPLKNLSPAVAAPLGKGSVQGGVAIDFIVIKSTSYIA